jgi:CopG family transcriptional regulator, nickel-responsive regulator
MMERRIFMQDLIRTSFSIEKKLLDKLEGMVAKSNYANRSEFIRDMIRDYFVRDEWQKNEEVVGTITLIYDHHKRELSERLTSLQHDHHEIILASTHIHLDTHMCAEMIMVKGPSEQVEEIANLLKQQVGVIHATLQMSSTGDKF